MPAVRLSMRKIREILRLKFDGGQTNRRIARSCHISRPTVADYLLRFEEAGLEWLAAEAIWTQQLPDWIGSHVRAFAFFGGVPELAVPDNLRSAVSKAHRYEPDLNPTYMDLASHYGVAVLPARVRKPRDKAKAEGRRAAGRTLDPGGVA